MSSKEEATPNYVTWEEMRRHTQYIQETLDATRKMMRLLVRILVDKKIIGQEMAKTFAESIPNEKELIEWFESVVIPTIGDPEKDILGEFEYCRRCGELYKRKSAKCPQCGLAINVDRYRKLDEDFVEHTHGS